MTAEELLNLPETRRRLDNYGDEYLINQKILKDLAKTKNYEENIFFHATGGFGESGIGRGLYLGKDRVALDNFYNNDGKEGEILKFTGNPKFIDLTDYDDFDEFEKQALAKYPNEKFNEHFKLLTLEKGYDGIRYYDPETTGEEFVLFKKNKVKLLKD